MSNAIGPFRDILFKRPSEIFKKHLESDNNDRILFSGKFGIGKSFFLQHFFRDDTQKALFRDFSYRVFHISPVNYSIAQTEDVFSYIKYDIILSMLQQGIELESKDFKAIDTLPGYLSKHFDKVLILLISMIPKVGKPVLETYERIKKFKDQFDEFSKKEILKPEDSLIDYIEKIEMERGSIFENDVVTKLIRSVLVNLKIESGRENVLIIDDLDRIDPAHLFRILNVFAAHLDEIHSIGNKLGFDKIILVCDINNVKSIFRSKYGIGTDFNGYIDKFYRRDIFLFNNQKELFELTYEAFRSVNFLGDERNHTFHSNSLFRTNSLPQELLLIFLSYGFINLRTLLTKIEYKIEYDPSRYLKFDEANLVREIDVVLLVHFQFLKEIIGGYDIVKEYVDRIPARAFQVNNLNSCCNQLLLFNFYEKTLRSKGAINIRFKNFIFRMNIPEKEALRDRLSDLLVFKIPTDETGMRQYNFSREDFKEILLDFIDLLIRVEKNN
jgi:hypothetical protein